MVQRRSLRKSRSRGGNRTQRSLLPGLSPAPSEAWLETSQRLSATALPTPQRHANPLHLCSVEFRTEASSSYAGLRRSLDGRGHLTKSIEGRWTRRDPVGWEGGLRAPQEVRCRRQAQKAITLPVWLRFYCLLNPKVSKVVINEKEI